MIVVPAEKDMGKVLRYLSRRDLEDILPHRDIALIASYGTIEGDEYSLYLDREDWGPYLNGHSFFFPMHWLEEMAALTVGVAIMNILKVELGERATFFDLPCFKQSGSWENSPLSPDLDSCHTIKMMCKASEINRSIGRIQVEVEATVCGTHGDLLAILNGLSGKVTNKAFLEKMKQKQSA